jgi:folate-dependent tRNA-U54 methylase TrmFO/GidA
MKNLFVSIIVLLFSFSYSQKHTISGNITGFNDGDVIKLGSIDEQKFVDSTTILKNKFVLKNNNIDDFPSGMYISINADKKYYNSNFIFIANESIKITGDKKDFPYNLKIIGSKNNDEMSQKLNDFKLETENEKIVDSMRSGIKIDTLQRIRLNKNRAKVETQRKNYINQNPNSYASLFHLGYLKIISRKIICKN